MAQIDVILQIFLKNVTIFRSRMESDNSVVLPVACPSTSRSDTGELQYIDVKSCSVTALPGVSVTTEENFTGENSYSL